jgi:DNA-binding CsgD family transcriptional regulator
VLARAARLPPAARRLLEAVAIVPQQTELWLLEALAGEDVPHLDECVSSGVITAEPGGVAFRHELARLAVEESLPLLRKIALHRSALVVLAEPRTGTPDLARLAHHAEAAQDAAGVLRYAPAAGERAASLGAHREAAAQFGRALRFAHQAPPEARAELLERRSFECFLTGDFGEAIAAQERALEYHRQLGDRRKEGDSLRSLSRLLRFVGRTDEAMDAGHRAVDILEALPARHELAMAYSSLSHLYMNAEDSEQTVAWANRATELGQSIDDPEAAVYALTNIGVVEYLAGAPEGVKKLERSLALARKAGLEEHAGRSFLSLVYWPIRQRHFELARRYLEAGLEYCEEHGVDLWRLMLLSCRARLELDEGRWAEAAESAAQVLRDPRTWPVPRILALSVLGTTRARRGDPDVWPPLNEALALAKPTGELQRIAPVAMARAEAAWLEGRPAAVAEATDAALELALRRNAAWVVGELAYWRWRAGIMEEIPRGPDPYTLQIAGDSAEAAERWAGIGCPYEAALAFHDANAPEGLRRALGDLQLLGARPAIAIVARRLRELGARGLPRGPRLATRENPANLTSRELEVLALVAQGLSNREIAERLFLSGKTVQHHLSAIFGKLDVHTRGQASVRAVQLGLGIPGEDE